MDKLYKVSKNKPGGWLWLRSWTPYCQIQTAIEVGKATRPFSSVQLLSHVRLCDPMDCSIPGFPVHHHLLELTQTHVHWVSDTIQPSHPLSSHSLLPSIFPSIRVFSSGSVLCIRWPKYWSFSFSISPSREYSGLISFRMGWLDLLAVQGTLKSLLQYGMKQGKY